MIFANQKAARGFTLIEMTIVIVISSLVLAAALAFIRPYFAQQQLDKTATSVQNVEDALAKFLNDFQRYPCPAPLKAAHGSADEGTEQCVADDTNVYAVEGRDADGNIINNAVLVGAIPYKALNIPSIAAADAFDNRMTYAVSLPSTNPPGPGGFDDNISDDGQISARVFIVDESGASIYRPTIAGVTRELPKHYFFFSHGRDGAGAHSNNGVLSGNPCNAGAAEGTNCDYLASEDGTFLAAFRSMGNTGSYNDDVSNEILRITAGLNDQYWAKTPSDPDNIYNLNSGNVGIGTNDAEAKLHVSGIDALIRLERDSKSVFIDANNTGSDEFAQIKSDLGMGLRLYSGSNTGAGGNPAIVIRDSAENGGNATTDIEFFTKPSSGASVERMRMTSNGRIGIGTNNPESQLHVAGVGASSQPIFERSGKKLWFDANSNDGNTWAQLAVDVGMGFQIEQKQGDNTWKNLFSVKSVLDDVPYVSGTTPVVPHVGIGLENPGRILDVNRNIRIRSAGADWWTSLDIWHNTNDGGKNPAITMYRGRGSFESPTGAQTNDVMGVFDARGTPSVISPPPGYGSGMVMRATENHGTGRMGTDLNLLTVPNGFPAARSRVRINENGWMVIGDNVLTATPAARLDVRGEIKVGNSGLACNNAVESTIGAVRYNPAIDKMEFCAYNGGTPQWKPMGGTGAIGAGETPNNGIVHNFTTPSKYLDLPEAGRWVAWLTFSYGNHGNGNMNPGRLHIYIEGKEIPHGSMLKEYDDGHIFTIAWIGETNTPRILVQTTGTHTSELNLYSWNAIKID